MVRLVLLLALAALLAGAAYAQEDSQPQHGDHGGPGKKKPCIFPGKGEEGSECNPRKYVLDITVGTAAPDCVSRKVLLVNGKLAPTLYFTQGEWVEVTVKNNVPTDWPSTSDGVTIHWHGFAMKGFQWMDGTNRVSQCPISHGTQYTYRFQVNEAPGTYFWHDHSSVKRADGLAGVLIVKPKPGHSELIQADKDAALFMSDWWHWTGDAMAFRLNRPFDPSKLTANSGAWCWVGLPKSIIINGKGNYYICEDVYRRVVGQPLPFRTDGYVANSSDLLAPNQCVAGQLGASAQNARCGATAPAGSPSGCQREVIKVDPGRTTRVRLINAATLVYLTVCFEKHAVTVVALDTLPVEPQTFSECVDVNSGQRVDVIIKADQPAASYWISVGSQYRKGAPNGYAVLQYSNAPSSNPDPNTLLQPDAISGRKWGVPQQMSFRPHPLLLSAGGSPLDKKKVAPYFAPLAPQTTYWAPPNVDKRFIIQSTQPLLEVNGVLRWALDSIASPVVPPCRPVLDLVYDDPSWAAKNALPVNSPGLDPTKYFTPMGGDPASWKRDGKALEVIDVASPNKDVVIKLGKPGAGTHVASVNKGEVIEVVIQNNRAGLYGGQYPGANSTIDSLTNNRNGREQHPFHLHGHHFWLVGMGLGEWTPDLVSTYNTKNPALRDTASVLFNGTTEDRAGWVALRFVANNTGVWPLHCHIGWHEFMGQAVNFIEDAQGIPKLEQPENLVPCDPTCTYKFASFSPDAINKVWGSSGLLAPENSNAPVPSQG